MDWLFCTLTIVLAFVLILICTVLYHRHIRPKFPVRVCCWFCNAYTKVPFGNRNCWDCPDCDQYNGFKQDGDYNKPIPAQYSEDMNYSITCQQADFLGGNTVLCADCNCNQLLKIKQLANYIPCIQENYDEEIDNYQRHLETVYKLCADCEFNVQWELQKQNHILGEKLRSSPVSAADSEDTQKIMDISTSASTQNKTLLISHVLSTLSTVCSFLLTFESVGHLYPDYTNEHIQLLEHSVNTVSLVGLLSCFLARISIGKQRLHGIDALVCPLWLVLLLICHTDCTHNITSVSYLQLSISSVILLLSLICMLLHRNIRNLPKQQIRRLSLDVNFSDTASIPVTSASEAAEAVERECVAHDSYLDDTLSELDAFSFGPPSSPKRNSGIFSSVPLFNPSPISRHTPIAQQMRKSRPVITPAKLNVAHLNRSLLTSGFQFGEKDCLEKNSFVSANFSSKSHFGKKTFMCHEKSSFVGGRSTPWSNSQFTEQRNNMDRYSNKSNSTDSSVCPVDSTTKCDVQLNKNSSWWKQPGFVGFVMGASLVGNIALLASVMWRN